MNPLPAGPKAMRVLLFCRPSRHAPGAEPFFHKRQEFADDFSAGVRGYVDGTDQQIAALGAVPDRAADCAVRCDRSRQPAGRGCLDLISASDQSAGVRVCALAIACLALVFMPHLGVGHCHDGRAPSGRLPPLPNSSFDRPIFFETNGVACARMNLECYADSRGRRVPCRTMSCIS